MITGITAVFALTGALLLLFGTGLPIFVTFLIVNVGGTFLLLGANGFKLLANSIYDTATTGSLTAIPLFILLGELLFRGRALTVMFRSIEVLVGRVRGRQFVLAVVLSTVFGALSGAAMGVAAMLGKTLLPGIKERGGSSTLAMGAIVSGASLAPIIPPSLLAIIVGTLAGVSIGDMLVGGIVPGLMLAVLFVSYILIRIRLDPSLDTDAEDVPPERGPGDVLKALLSLAPFTIIVGSIMGFIMAGIATPSEAAATGVLGALATTMIYERLSFSVLKESVLSATRISAMILLIMASSKMFSQLLAMSGGISAMTSMISAMDLPGWAMLLVLMAFPFIMCMFIDQTALMLIVVPIYSPIVAHYGFDPLWFWLIFLVNITVGGITPPFGYVLFALQGSAPNEPMTAIFRSAWPFVWIFILGMVIMAAFPPLVTFLPSLTR
ncbi:trap dicarboxylate transporter, dctm subunit [Citreicella sp. SE45]|uniref:TRAP transporter, DctM subunit n=1 Tax=Salipiger thiooxidans TaxID=282683 RepID=A0A1G7FJG3_9RHOB|nr:MULTISPECIES: TRAP transporter large permease subunit [Salipiger]EEX11668.1 trap dicarboxylate transporter, dctm subunit [Citreicella sp. SE45]NIY94867.1 TRAP transporter large permease subunit [Salipiger sp. HF18]NVK61967.1 TRAP transporter large permease subunit [Paracoccaceae bacterium]SDE76023.1 TRAP transporter, DctM subunit [Salipiger thiooxidans]